MDEREIPYSGGLLAGVDEVGRGPLAGPVVTAAVILDPDNPVGGLRDSKKLSERRREGLYGLIRKRALAWCLGRCEVAEIDQLNIHGATMLAMERAVAGLSPAPGFVVVDGHRCPDWDWPSMAVVRGDNRLDAIAAASILAKVSRDREMVVMDATYPGYGLAGHKGYPTQAHIEALRKLGASPVHRSSFAPVRDHPPIS